MHYLQFPIIYKRTSTGAIQQWQQEINQDCPSQFRTISGQIDGKKVTSAWRDCYTTNEGKKNERNPAEQCVFEVQSNYKKKLDKDYHLSIDDIDIQKIFKPMTARKFEELEDKISYPVIAQPKLDGMRCIATKDGLFSRNGKEIISCPHIHQKLKPIFERYPDTILDGELYNHEYKDDFNSIISSAKKTKPTQQDLEESARLIEYHVYDLPSESLKNYPSRFSILCDLITELKDLAIIITETARAIDRHDLDAIYQTWVEEGYEGQMIRIMDCPYESKRSKGLIKRKDWTDAEFELVSIEEGQGNWAGKAKKAWFKFDKEGPLTDDNLFKAGVKGTMEYCENVFKNKEKYVGTMCTVIYCPQLTPDGVPRFGRVKEFNRADIF